MSNAIFGYTNYIETGTLAAGSAAPGLDVSQLKVPQGSTATAWQTATGVVNTAGGAWFTIDTGGTVQWQAFLLARTNLTPSATIRWIVSNASNFSSPTYDSTFNSAGVVPGFGQTLRFLSAPVSGRYARCEIRDPSNPDNFISVGLAYAGPVWQLPINIGWDSTVNVDVVRDEVVTRGGQEFPQFRYEKRRWDVSLPHIPKSDLWSRAAEFHRTARRGGNILFVPDPDVAEANREAIFGRSETLSDIEYGDQSDEFRSWRFRITERL